MKGLKKNLKSQMDLSVRYNKAIMSDPYKKSYILERILKEGSFEDNYPERALDWDYNDERNQPYKPSDFLSGSNKLVYWKCHVCGYKSITRKTIISHAKAKFPCEKCAIKGRSNQRYGEEPITVTKNCRIYAKGTNVNGSTVEYIDITNIGNKAPRKKEKLNVQIQVSPEPELTIGQIEKATVTINMTKMQQENTIK